MPASIEDVAKKARVSISTVSRVVNRPQMVSDETRERVERAIAQLAYVPSLHAQALMRGRSDLPNLGTPRRRQA